MITYNEQRYLKNFLIANGHQNLLNEFNECIDYCNRIFLYSSDRRWRFKQPLQTEQYGEIVGLIESNDDKLRMYNRIVIKRIKVDTDDIEYVQQELPLNVSFLKSLYEHILKDIKL